jgi:long-chain acyl-CoA synthetase
MLTNRNFTANVSSIREAISISSADRLLLALPLHHAFPFTVGLLAGVAVGGEVTLESDLLQLRRDFLRTKPTVFLGVPQLFTVMYRNIQRTASTGPNGRLFGRALSLAERTKKYTRINIGPLLFRKLHTQLGGKLRFMISGGSAMDPGLIRNFFRLGIPILQGWGLTETAPVVAVQRWSQRRFYFSDYYERRIGSVGQAVAGVEVKLLDVQKKQIGVAADGAGELAVRGPNVTLGYWQAEEATNEAIQNGWFKTGDLGRIDDEGNIWLTGRSKYTIVLESGEKIQPEEIEEKLAHSGLIEDVVVVAGTDRGKTEAWAIIYPRLNAVQERLSADRIALETSSVQELINRDVQRIQKDIAPHKWPSRVLLTDEPLPKTAIGKVARKDLPERYDFDLQRWLQPGDREPNEPTSQRP